VKLHLFKAIANWVGEFLIDGLRLDSVDSLDMEFLKEVSQYCHQLKPNFWLMGEVIHGDHRDRVKPSDAGFGHSL
jgi:cyclomaltodextrinase